MYLNEEQQKKWIHSSQHANPCARCREVRRMSKVTVDGRRDSIGDARLLNESRQEQHYRRPNIDIGKPLAERAAKKDTARTIGPPLRAEETNEQRKIRQN